MSEQLKKSNKLISQEAKPKNTKWKQFVALRVEAVEKTLNKRFVQQTSELEKLLRMQIEMEMKDGNEALQKEGTENAWPMLMELSQLERSSVNC
ncbi:unnamed protein product, partial [Mesorhabditis spiculigera]